MRIFLTIIICFCFSACTRIVERESYSDKILSNEKIDGIYLTNNNERLLLKGERYLYVFDIKEEQALQDIIANWKNWQIVERGYNNHPCILIERFIHEDIANNRVRLTVNFVSKEDILNSKSSFTDQNCGLKDKFSRTEYLYGNIYQTKNFPLTQPVLSKPYSVRVEEQKVTIENVEEHDQTVGRFFEGMMWGIVLLPFTPLLLFEYATN